MCHLLSVHEQRAGGAFPDAAAIVREMEARDVIARRERLVRNDAELMLRLIRLTVCLSFDPRCIT